MARTSAGHNTADRDRPRVAHGAFSPNPRARAGHTARIFTNPPRAAVLLAWLSIAAGPLCCGRAAPRAPKGCYKSQ
eukprot:scaffold91785_cov42-Phaeocystis_antarctica.AAC.1